MKNCCNQCDPCKPKCCPEPCGCPTQIMGISTVHDDTPAWLRYNFGGKSVDYDYTSVVKFAETDTSMRLDIPGRNLVFNAEKHIDSFSASELGSILHISDLGDVDISGVTDNSLFVFQKNSDCGEGCEGIDNSWIAWNSNENLVSMVETVMGFDANGKPKALNHPSNTTQFYQLGWNGANKVGWTQPVEAASKSSVADSDGKVWRLYLDPGTKQIRFIKENQ